MVAMLQDRFQIALGEELLKHFSLEPFGDRRQGLTGIGWSGSSSCLDNSLAAPRRMSKPQITSPMAALAATADETARREQATVSAWGELMQAARVTAAEQDLDLRYVAVLDQ